MTCKTCNTPNPVKTLHCTNCGTHLYKSKIRVVKEDGENTTHYLFEQDYTIGRSSTNDIMITDESISRHHAQLTYEDGVFLINDLNSKNGSLLNNLTLKKSLLRHEDCIQLGNVVLHFYDVYGQSGHSPRQDTIHFVQREYFKLSEKRENRITTGDVLQTMMELVVSLVGAEKGAILKFLKPSKLEYKLGRGFIEGQVEINACLKEDYSLFERAVHSRETQFKCKQQVGSGIESVTAQFEWERIAIPLISTVPDDAARQAVEDSGVSDVLGVCYLSNGDPQNTLSKRKTELLKALVQQMSLAMENEMLHQINVANSRLRHEVTLAMDMQKRLLPMATPSPASFRIVSFIEPCEALSGDYYDVIQISEDAIAFAIGDVCGKGIPAALLSSTAQAAIRSQIEKSTKPAEIVGNLDAMFVENTASFVFLTLFFGILNLESNTLRFVNAGHPPPIFVSRNLEVRELFGTMPPLGIQQTQEHVDHFITFNPGDMLLMYTDGVIESQNRKKEIYGRHRFLELIQTIFAHRKSHRYSVDYVVGKIKADLLSFMEGTSQSDDLTLLAAKRKR